MTKISVLVAVYNTERFLRECLDSLLRQTLKDIQVICIDDASTDESLSILQEYAEADERVEVISLPSNSGSGAARNAGLPLVKGDYVCFVDSDDWLEPDALENILKVFDEYPNTDSVLFDMKYWQDAKTSSYLMDDFDVLSGQEAFEKSLDWRIHGVYATRKSLQIRFPYDTTSRTYSDDNTTRLHYLYSREVRRSNAVYYYRQHDQSVTHVISISRFDYLIANRSMKECLLTLKVPERIMDLYENHMWLNVVGLYMFYYRNRKHFTSSERKYALDVIRKSWEKIEVSRLTLKNKCKFGYIPFKSCWHVFRFEEEVYFFLRGILGH